MLNCMLRLKYLANILFSVCVMIFNIHLIYSMYFIYDQLQVKGSIFVAYNQDSFGCKKKCPELCPHGIFFYIFIFKIFYIFIQPKHQSSNRQKPNNCVSLFSVTNHKYKTYVYLILTYNIHYAYTQGRFVVRSLKINLYYIRFF